MPRFKPEKVVQLSSGTRVCNCTPDPILLQDGNRRIRVEPCGATLPFDQIVAPCGNGTSRKVVALPDGEAVIRLLKEFDSGIIILAADDAALAYRTSGGVICPPRAQGQPASVRMLPRSTAGVQDLNWKGYNSNTHGTSKSRRPHNPAHRPAARR